MFPHLIQFLGQDPAERQGAARLNPIYERIGVGDEDIGLNIGEHEIALASARKTRFQIGHYKIRLSQVRVLLRIAVADNDRFRIEVEGVEMLESKRSGREGEHLDPQPASMT